MSDWSGTPQAGNPAEEYSGKRDPAAFEPGHAQSNTKQKGRLNTKTGEYVFGFSKYMRARLPWQDALPTPVIGFTGSPISTKDKDTRRVFGDYVSIYDIQDAVDEGDRGLLRAVHMHT